jgi:hypothetical protein
MICAHIWITPSKSLGLWEGIARCRGFRSVCGLSGDNRRFAIFWGYFSMGGHSGVMREKAELIGHHSLASPRNLAEAEHDGVHRDIDLEQQIP